MIFAIGVIVASIIVVIMMRRAGRRGRLVHKKGTIPVRMCPDPRCGLPAGKCQHRRREAERATGILGKKK